jgi:hypothetical protein
MLPPYGVSFISWIALIIIVFSRNKNKKVNARGKVNGRSKLYRET